MWLLVLLSKRIALQRCGVVVGGGEVLGECGFEGAGERGWEAVS